VDVARAGRKWIGLCGEMGGQKRYLPLLVGLGLDEISVSAPAIGGLKAELSRLELADCRKLFASALECVTADEVGDLLDQFSAEHTLPLLAPEMIVMNADAATKEEAIKRGVDLLYVHGRTEQPRVVEEAIWQREANYSTGFGHGFAIPHCKSATINANSIAVLKFPRPIPWDSLDNKPVQVVILMVIRDSDGATEHMKIISALARQVMHEEFRSNIENEQNPINLCNYLKSKIGC